MKQLFQSLKTGKTEIIEIPVPEITENNILIKTKLTLISSGTERMIVDFGKANLVDKVKKQPEKVNEVFQKINSDGFLSTYDAIQNKLDKPIPLGYSNVGTVIQCGNKVKGFQVGDRVLSNGSHAEIVSVPYNLVSKIPDEVGDSEAVFTVLASIGLQGIRLSKPTLGEVFLVNGLGLIGLLTGQLLIQNGIKVLGIDPDSERCNLARSLGIDALQLTTLSDPISWCKDKTNGNDIDAVIITAATKSNQPVDLSAKVCRKRGRIILVGSTGLDLKRELFYKKELTFQVSCAYGPGRYDQSYEEKGIDYPIGFVRWTEQRNFVAILDIFKRRKIITKDLISKTFNFEEAAEAYELLVKNSNVLGILLKFKSEEVNLRKTLEFNSCKESFSKIEQIKPKIGFIGAGNYASRVLLPTLKRAKASVEILGALSGSNSVFLAKKFGIKKVTTDIDCLIRDKIINTIIIATRHDSHAELVKKALESDKNIFVEKPLCLNKKDLDDIKEIYNGKRLLMVGYNRRFSPLVQILKNKLDPLKSPKCFIYTCNAGYIPNDHWTKDIKIGGGRLIGECCHFVDLLRFLSNSKIESFSISKIPTKFSYSDSFTLNISFIDGSIGTIHYFTNGYKGFPKERIEVYVNGKIFRIDNFKKLESWGENYFKSSHKSKSKGQFECVSEFLNSIEKGENNVIPFDEILEVQNLLLEALNK